MSATILPKLGNVRSEPCDRLYAASAMSFKSLLQLELEIQLFLIKLNIIKSPTQMTKQCQSTLAKQTHISYQLDKKGGKC